MMISSAPPGTNIQKSNQRSARSRPPASGRTCAETFPVICVARCACAKFIGMSSSSVRRTRIVATLGPATDADDILERILREGVDVVRLNLSHGTAADHKRRAEAVRAAAQKIGCEVGVLADLQGPKIRVERFASGAVMLQPGQPFTLDCRKDAPPGDEKRVGVSYLGLPDDV